MPITSNFVKTYSTMSGIDIKALFDDMQIMTVQGVAVSVTREKVPIYIMGNEKPVSISRGKRGIAGTLQFMIFDREPLYVLMHDERHYYYAHSDNINWLTNTSNPAEYQKIIGNANKIPQTDNTIGVQSKRVPAEYLDQIYPFDVTLTGMNEYGNGSFSAIIGVEIINEGTGVSTDDMTSEVQSTYIALHRLPWTPLDKVDAEGNYWASNVDMDENGNIYVLGGTGDLGDNRQNIPGNGQG